MKAITARWKTLVAVLVAGVALFFVMARMAVGQPRSPAQPAPAVVPAAQTTQEPPPSNEIRDYQQLD
ncbi:MAG TPA: hypothetical protein VE964_08455 [Myxococcales bacterium]|nr:hypothetical protein [Myxococcales bacterium]